MRYRKTSMLDTMNVCIEDFTKMGSLRYSLSKLNLEERRQQNSEHIKAF